MAKKKAEAAAVVDPEVTSSTVPEALAPDAPDTRSREERKDERALNRLAVRRARARPGGLAEEETPTVRVGSNVLFCPGVGDPGGGLNTDIEAKVVKVHNAATLDLEYMHGDQECSVHNVKRRLSGDALNYKVQEAVDAATVEIDEGGKLKKVQTVSPEEVAINLASRTFLG